MFNYIVSYGSYSDYRELHFCSENKYTEKELFNIVKDCAKNVKERDGDVFGDSLSEEMDNAHGIKAIEFEAVVSCGDYDIEDILY